MSAVRDARLALDALGLLSCSSRASSPSASSGPVRIAMHPLIYDWNATSSPRPPVVLLDDETLRDGLQSPSVRMPTIDEKLRILHLIDRARDRYGGHRPAGRRAARRARRRAAGARDCRRAAARDGQLRGAHARRRHQADRRDLAARRDPDRVLRVHRLEPAAAVRRRLDDRSAPEADRGGDCLRGAARGCRSCT